MSILRRFLPAVLAVCALLLAACNPYSVYKDKRSLETQLDDAAIEASIKAKLMDRNFSEGWDVSVYSYTGKVFLVGQVPPKFRNQAELVAEDEKGVRSVTTHWFSDPGSQRDVGIRLRVNQNLIEARNVQSTRVDVYVHDAEVLLFGMVDSQAAVDRIVRITKDTEGVKKVLSYLIVAGN